MAEGEKYVWRQNNACVATYKVLEGDAFLDQFEDADIPFAKAGATKLKSLRYFPRTTSNPRILEVLSLEMARGFLKHIVKVFTVAKQDPGVASGAIIQNIANVFADGEKTIRDLAEIVDENIKFPDEP
jgi:hypothetical protein